MGATNGGWTLALNIAANDANKVPYQNDAFWESTKNLGGASAELNPSRSPFSRDFKSLLGFNMPANEILIMVHNNDGVAKGWRAWKLVSHGRSLAQYLHGGQSCTYGMKGGNKNVQQMKGKSTLLASGKIAEQVKSLPNLKCDPVINSWSPDKLFVNVDTENNIDYARISAIPKMGASKHDSGHGLGYGGDCHFQFDAKRGGPGCTNHNQDRKSSVVDQTYAIFVRGAE